jgi:hypothetical protein
MQDKQPQPPEGFQRPGIPGAGNIFDPAVRGELREKMREAMPQHPPAHAHGASSGEDAGAPSSAAAGAAAPAATGESPPAAPKAYRAGPFPHGDVDLRGFWANVPAEPVRPKRRRGGRRFYFLPESGRESGHEGDATQGEAKPSGPKPG